MTVLNMIGLGMLAVPFIRFLAWAFVESFRDTDGHDRFFMVLFLMWFGITAILICT